MTPQDLSAIVFLALLPLPLLIWAVVQLRRSPYTPVQSVLFFLDVLLTRIWWRAEIPRRLPVQPGQGAVLICNHRTSVDPFYIQIPAGRPVHWMVAREYCEMPIVGWFLRTVEVIPVGRRGIDTAATRTAIRLAANGELVGVFPEGRINQTDQFLLPGRPGAVRIALKARVPILPCYIEGAPYGGSMLSPFYTPARVRVRFGQPIDLSAYYGRERDADAMREATLRCMSEIARLAGRTDFQPQLAARRWVLQEPETG